MDTTRLKLQGKSLVDIPIDRELPGMATLLDSTQVLSVLREHAPKTVGEVRECRVAYVRYKPNTNCLVSYIVSFKPSASGETKTVWLSGKCFTESDFTVAQKKRANLTFTSLIGMTCPIVLKEERIIILPAEWDPLIKGLETAFDSRKLVRLLHKHIERYPKQLWRISDKRCVLDFIRFKPEKRAVLRLFTKVIHRNNGEKKNVVWYVRAYVNGSSSQQHSLLSDLSEQFAMNPSVGVATSLANIKDKDLLIIENAEGFPLEGNLGNPEVCSSIERVGHALALLHTFRSTRVPVRPLREQFSDIASNAESLKALVSGNSADINQVVNRIESLRPKGNTSSAGFVHGDFHPGQVLLDSDRVMILDFDRAHVGDPVCDLGNFAAYLHLGELRSEITNSAELIRKLLDSYYVGNGNGNGIDTVRVRFWTLVGLFGLAVSPFRTQRPHWRTEIGTIIERCLQL